MKNDVSKQDIEALEKAITIIKTDLLANKVATSQMLSQIAALGITLDKLYALTDRIDRNTRTLLGV